MLTYPTQQRGSILLEGMIAVLIFPLASWRSSVCKLLRPRQSVKQKAESTQHSLPINALVSCGETGTIWVRMPKAKRDRCPA